ncbi:hypothetical protein PENTCL1PPCAC_27356, partial [Pristionchus entomophagus]
GDDTGPCVIVEKTLDGRLQVAGKKGFPHVIYCKIFRFKETHKNELKSLPCCAAGFDNMSVQAQDAMAPLPAAGSQQMGGMKGMDGQKLPVCVNPYHYKIVPSTESNQQIHLNSLNVSPDGIRGRKLSDFNKDIMDMDRITPSSSLTNNFMPVTPAQLSTPQLLQQLLPGQPHLFTTEFVSAAVDKAKLPASAGNELQQLRVIQQMISLDPSQAPRLRTQFIQNQQRLAAMKTQQPLAVSISPSSPQNLERPPRIHAPLPSPNQSAVAVPAAPATPATPAVASTSSAAADTEMEEFPPSEEEYSEWETLMLEHHAHILLVWIQEGIRLIALDPPRYMPRKRGNGMVQWYAKYMEDSTHRRTNVFDPVDTRLVPEEGRRGYLERHFTKEKLSYEWPSLPTTPNSEPELIWEEPGPSSRPSVSEPRPISQPPVPEPAPNSQPPVPLLSNGALKKAQAVAQARAEMTAAAAATGNGPPVKKARIENGDDVGSSGEGNSLSWRLEERPRPPSTPIDVVGMDDAVSSSTSSLLPKAPPDSTTTQPSEQQQPNGGDQLQPQPQQHPLQPPQPPLQLQLVQQPQQQHPAAPTSMEELQATLAALQQELRNIATAQLRSQQQQGHPNAQKQPQPNGGNP